MEVLFLEASPFGGAEVAVYIADTCPVAGCVASSADPDLANWYNSGGSTATVYAVVKAMDSSDNFADVAVSLDGETIYVLTDQGHILIYGQDGGLLDRIEIGAHAERIAVGPEGEKLFVSSRQRKTVEVVSVNFIHKINTSGSPSKGTADAPVVMAVFSDFQ